MGSRCACAANYYVIEKVSVAVRVEKVALAVRVVILGDCRLYE